MRYYTPSHFWIEIEDDRATLGITRALINQLHEIVFLEFLSSKDVCQDDPLIVLESSKAAMDLYSPLSGKVIATQDDLELLAEDPENKGWLVKLAFSDYDPSPWMTKEEYQAFLNTKSGV